MHRHLTSLISPVLRRWKPIMFWPVLITCFRALLILCRNENEWMWLANVKAIYFTYFQIDNFIRWGHTNHSILPDLVKCWTKIYVFSKLKWSFFWMIDVHTTCHRSIQTLLRHLRLGRVGQMNPKTNGLTSQTQQPHHSVPKKRGKISCGLLVWFPCGES